MLRLNFILKILFTLFMGITASQASTRILTSAWVLLGGGPGMSVSYLERGLEHVTFKAPIHSYQHYGATADMPLPDTVTRMSDFTKQLDDFATSKGLDKFRVIAHSWGSCLAMEYCKDYPGKIEDMILISPLPFKHNKWQSAVGKLVSTIPAEVMGRLGELNGDNDPEGRIMMDLFNPYYCKRPIPKGIFTYNDPINNKINDMMGEFDHSALASSLPMPSLCIVGDGDPFWEGERPETNGAIEVMRDVGHYPFFEDREGFAAILTKYGYADPKGK